MIDYKVLNACNGDQLAFFVKDKIGQGWEVTGGLSVVHDSNTGLGFYQAMVLKSEPIPLSVLIGHPVVPDLSEE